MSRITVYPVGITRPLLEEIPEADDLIAYCARVSNPQNQTNWETADKLLNYCAEHGHWSVFEMVNVCLSVAAPRDIARQLLRHRSFHFQEFSQRYAAVDEKMYAVRELRTAHPTNRQLSIPVTDEALCQEWEEDQRWLIGLVQDLSRKWRDRGIANECVRVLNPEGLTYSRLYVNATVRDLWHYYRVRSSAGTQAEHRELAQGVGDAMYAILPRTWAALIGDQPDTGE